MAHRRPRLTVIVPTRNEADNVGPLIAGLGRAVGGRESEVVFVDDSDDATAERIRAHARLGDGEVRLLHREPKERHGGLGGAVAAGLASARGDWVCVIDGDLQHPPETVPLLLRAAERQRLDLVVATRFGNGGSDGGLGFVRRLVSRGSAAAARLLFPRRLRGVSDPMSGFFLLRREAVDPNRLQPDGFKILLEILVRTSLRAVGEVPYAFAERHAGDSKASLREGFRFLRQLVRLRLPEPTGRFVRFGFIGGTGLVVNESLLALLTERARLYYLASAIVSTQLSILWNFALTERWVYRRRDCRLDLRARLCAFCLVCTTAQVATTPILYVLVDAAAVPYLLANLIAIPLATVVRFAVAERVIWKRQPLLHSAAAHPNGSV